jgi:gluconate 2-dehydrogenase gamma chain
MDRRKSIKALIASGVAASTLIEACKLADKKAEVPEQKAEGPTPLTINRMPEELAHYQQEIEQRFFSEPEMATITLLGDIIIPRDQISGSASDARVPEFIEFIVKDKPELQTPMRGGLRWLDLQCLHRYDKAFRDCSPDQQMDLVDLIAWPKKAKPEMSQGVAFFTLMRNLTASGFYTSEIGVKDVGYVGNVPNQWNGVPDDVLKQYNLAYSDRELKECVSFDAKV